MLDKVSKAYWRYQLKVLCFDKARFEGAAVVTVDGLLVAAVLSSDVDAEHLAPSLAVAASLGNQLAAVQRRGNHSAVINLWNKSGLVRICPLDKEFLLMILFQPDAKTNIGNCSELFYGDVGAPVYVTVGGPKPYLEAEAEGKLDKDE
jgi:predicted regulator of Ras-like GTPase activity (Roadblock/LC7/MglB family)